MDAEEIKNILDAEQTDEEKKKDLITNEIPKLGEHPSEEIVRILFRIIKKPTINEATSGVYDAAVSYLKSIQRY